MERERWLPRRSHRARRLIAGAAFGFTALLSSACHREPSAATVEAIAVPQGGELLAATRIAPSGEATSERPVVISNQGLFTHQGGALARGAVWAAGERRGAGAAERARRAADLDALLGQTPRGTSLATEGASG